MTRISEVTFLGKEPPSGGKIRQTSFKTWTNPSVLLSFRTNPVGGGVKFNRGSAVPEMLIAVVILGVVASIAAPRFFNNSPF